VYLLQQARLHDYVEQQGDEEERVHAQAEGGVDHSEAVVEQ